jgi:uncharacterized OB-fold protein
LNQSVTFPDAQFQRYLEEGRLMIQRNRVGGKGFYYPRVAEPLTGTTSLEWVESSGRGVVYSTTVVRTKPPAEPYNVALIDLEEGPRVTSRVVGIAPTDVKIGMKVKAKIDASAKPVLLVFEPLD